MCVGGAKLLSRVQLLATPWTVARQAALSMGFPRQEYWSGLPCPPPGDLPNPGIKPASLMSPALADGFPTSGATWEAPKYHVLTLFNPMDCSLPGSSVYRDSPCKNTIVGCHSFLQGIFLTQELNPGLLYWRQILYHLSHQRFSQNTIWFSKSTAGYISKESKNTNSKKYMQPNVQICIIHNSQDVEATYVSTKKWMDTEDVLWICAAPPSTGSYSLHYCCVLLLAALHWGLIALVAKRALPWLCCSHRLPRQRPEGGMWLPEPKHVPLEYEGRRLAFSAAIMASVAST